MVNVLTGMAVEYWELDVDVHLTRPYLYSTVGRILYQPPRVWRAPQEQTLSVVLQHEQDESRVLIGQPGYSDPERGLVSYN